MVGDFKVYRILKYGKNVAILSYVNTQINCKVLKTGRGTTDVLIEQKDI